MPGTTETPLAVEESYRRLIREAIKAAGGQRRAAKLVDVNQATISRALKRGHNVSYTTLRKIADALPGLPDPVVPVRDAEHERWCKIGSELAEVKPEEFRSLLNFAERAMSDAGPRLTDEQVARVKAVIASPMPARPPRPRPRG